MNRRLSISTSLDYALPIEAQVPLIAEAGFTHLSLGENADHSGYPDPHRRRHLRQLVAAHGLHFDTLHGPPLDGERSEHLAIAIAAAADLGAPVVVAHAGPFDFPAAELPVRLETIRRRSAEVTPLLEQTGTVLALENVMPGPATDLVRLALAELDSRCFGFCYDSAHDQIDGPRPFTLLHGFGDRLKAVHLSDRVREFVDHVPPGDGCIDWGTLSAAMRATPFAGPLLFEVMVLHATEQDPTRLLRRTYDRGSALYDQIFAGRTDTAL
jgi:sugar phosphate isomerase/epimerase